MKHSLFMPLLFARRRRGYFANFTRRPARAKSQWTQVLNRCRGRMRLLVVSMGVDRGHCRVGPFEGLVYRHGVSRETLLTREQWSAHRARHPP